MSKLERERYINFATFRRNGRAVETPVWFAHANGRLYVSSSGNAGKVKRLRNFSRARIAACTVTGRLRGEWIEVIAHIVDDPETIDLAHRALHSKYRVQMWLADRLSKLTGRFDQRAIIEIEI